MQKNRVFTEEEISKYMDYVDKEVLELEEILGRCFQCGRPLDEVELPEGPERKVVCLKKREDFVAEYEELIKEGILD